MNELKINRIHPIEKKRKEAIKNMMDITVQYYTLYSIYYIYIRCMGAVIVVVLVSRCGDGWWSSSSSSPVLLQAEARLASTVQYAHTVQYKYYIVFVFVFVFVSNKQ